MPNMLFETASFEFRYQSRSPVFWASLVAVFALAFLSVASDSVRIGSVGNTNINAPAAIVMATSVFSIVSLFAALAFIAGAVARDEETGFGAILHSSGISKFEYLFGRLLGALALSMLLLGAAPLGLCIGALAPWVDREQLGPLSVLHYFYAYFVIGVPNLIVGGALLFSLAAATRSTAASYVGLVLFMALNALVGALLAQSPLAGSTVLFDPFGHRALLEQTKYWTAAERNEQLPSLTGVFMANRAMWALLALGALTATYFSFRFSRRARSRANPHEAPTAQPVAAVVGQPIRFDRATASRQAWARIGFEAAYILRGPAFFGLMAIGLMNAVGALWDADRFLGVGIYPVTRVMTQALNDAFALIPILMAAYFAGELVWRDRDRRMYELVDSTPTATWSFLVPKAAALTGVLAVGIAVAALAGVGVQALKAFNQFEPPQYLAWFVLPQLLTAFAIASLAIFLHTISPNKFVGWGGMFAYVLAAATLPRMGFDHDLYLFGLTPPRLLSDMDVHNHYWIGPAWFGAYWAIGALILLVSAYALWRRGADVRLLARLVQTPRRLGSSGGVLLAALMAAFAGVGAWIFYNTNVLNAYESAPMNERWRASLERALVHYEGAPQATIVAVNANVDLYPTARAAHVRGYYDIENRTGAALGELHLSWPRRLRVGAVQVAGGDLVRDYGRESPSFPFQVWRFNTPMAPGERRRLSFEASYRDVGFRTNDTLSEVNRNGTFLRDTDLTPTLGFSRQGLIRDPDLRRRHGLPEERRVAPLEDESALRFNQARHDSDWITLDLTVSTDADQIAIAPGRVIVDQSRGGRRTTRFVSDTPIIHYYAIQSAAYAVERREWRGADLAVYYHPIHEYNVARMLNAMQASLELYDQEFSPFQFDQMRIVEFPAYYSTFAQSSANTIPYSEGLGFIARFDSDEDDIDYVTYVTAHEVAHQWWGHQILGADMQGANMLTESLAQYSALIAMERLYGRGQVRRFLRYELDTYLRERSAEVVEELPLMRVEQQPYIYYRKGGLVMYLLRNEIGEAAVNRALRRLLREFAFRGAPYPRSSDLVRFLREEAGPAHQAMITDLFERITLYDVAASAAQASRRTDGRWDISLTVQAQKLYADGQGHETVAPMNEEFEIGVFSTEPGASRFRADDVIHFERRRLQSGRSVVRLTVDREPRYVGIDPYNMRIDRVSGDNVIAIERN